MKIINYFDTENKEYYLEKIAKSDWDAAHFLHYLLKDNNFFELVGENSRVLLLVDGENLVSFCTLAEKDDVQPTDLTPWIGWIYTFPEYRGKHLAGELLAHAEALAKLDGATYTHISTNHVGLYEKYGYEFFITAKDVEGEDTRVYRKKL
ncbi:MAG: GNAT family N-acetyltransferase [Clostridia bacterium]|nr:GNAT family N-acetyltransferase [Clostridia bacterium]